MPRSKCGIKRVFTNKTDLEGAVNEVVQNTLSVIQAVSIFNVPKTTLLRHIKSNINHRLVFTVD